MLYLIFVRLTGWLALTWIRRGLPGLGGLVRLDLAGQFPVPEPAERRARRSPRQPVAGRARHQHGGAPAGEPRRVSEAMRFG